MTTYQPRWYQREAADAALTYLQNPKLKNRNGIVVAPTGSGKSLVIAEVATKLDGPCVVFQPRKEILEQNLAKLAGYGYRASVFSASMGRREIGQITLATIGSVIRHAEAFKDIPYVIIDEADDAVNPKGGMFTDFLDVVSNARILGLTATPFRLASNSFGSELRFLTRTRPRVFRDVVHYTQIGRLFTEGYLSPLVYREVESIDRTRLKLNTKGSDYTDESVQGHLLEVGFVGRLQAEVERQLDEGRKNVLVFTRFISESERLAKVVPGTAVVTGETPPSERERILSDFKRGRIRVVANVGVLTVGFDYPELECAILARPSISLRLFYQQVGRILRPHPSKPVGHVVDMVGLVRQFGKIEDLEMRPGGARGDSWAIYSGPRQLTNQYFHEAANVDPKAVAKAIKNRRFWAKRKIEERSGA